jgi:hypothetical protein
MHIVDGLRRRRPAGNVSVPKLLMAFSPEITRDESRSAVVMVMRVPTDKTRARTLCLRRELSHDQGVNYPLAPAMSQPNGVRCQVHHRRNLPEEDHDMKNRSGPRATGCHAGARLQAIRRSLPPFR